MSQPTINLDSSQFSPPPAGQPGCRSNAPTNAGTQAPAPIFGSVRWPLVGGGSVSLDDPLAVVDAVWTAMIESAKAEENNIALGNRLRASVGDAATFTNADGSRKTPNTTEWVMFGRAVIAWMDSLGKESAPPPTSGPTAA